MSEDVKTKRYSKCFLAGIVGFGLPEISGLYLLVTGMFAGMEHEDSALNKLYGYYVGNGYEADVVKYLSTSGGPFANNQMDAGWVLMVAALGVGLLCDFIIRHKCG